MSTRHACTVFLFILSALLGWSALDGADLPSVQRFREWMEVTGPEDEGVFLARQRRDALRTLLREDPDAVLAAAVSGDQARDLPLAVQAELEEELEAEGAYHVIAKLPELGAAVPDDWQSVRQYVEIEGHWREAHVPVALQGVQSQSRVRLRGFVIDDQVVLSDLDPAADDPVEDDVPLAMDGGDLARSAWTEGPKTCLFIIARCADDTGYPQTIGDADNRMDATSDRYLRMSYGKTWFASWEIIEVTLPYNRSEYGTNDGQRTFYQLYDDALAAASAAGYDRNHYNLDVVRHPSLYGGWSGMAWVGARGMWMQANNTGVLIHEFGHNWGAWHSNFWEASFDSVIGPGRNREYGDDYDFMGASQSNSDFNNFWKRRFDWLTDAYVESVTGNGVYRLHTHEVANLTDGHTYALRVQKDTRWYWISHRVGRNNAWMRNGVLLKWAPWGTTNDANTTTGSNSGTQLLDTTPSSPNGKHDASIVVGRTFSDHEHEVHITPIRRVDPDGVANNGDEYMDVFVAVGPQSGNRPPTASLAVSSIRVAVGEAIHFSVSASDPDGDDLYYHWDFDDNSLIVASLNQPMVSKSWNTAGQYAVRVAVSDGRGGLAGDKVVVTVGDPANQSQIWGRVLWGGRPVEGAKVVGGGVTTWTLADGSYVLSGLAAGSHSVTASKYGLTFTRQFTNPVTVPENAYGCDFHANEALTVIGGGSVYSVSGTVRDNGVSVAGATVVLAGRSTVSASNGTWTITGVPDGTGNATAYKDAMQFTPVAVAVNGANVTGVLINRTDFTVSGQVSMDADGVPVTVRMGTYSQSGTSIRQGNNRFFDYSIVVPPGSYTVVASVDGRTATPDGWTNPVTVNGNVGTCHFSTAIIATPPLQIRGMVTVNGMPAAGVVVSATGAANATSTTGADGGFVLGNLVAGAYTVTPSLPDWTFTPASRSVTLETGDSTDQNFSLNDTAPTVATAAAASPSLVPQSDGSTQLSVLGADDGGEAHLTYLWTVTAGPYPVSFSANGTNAAKDTTATFSAPGAYAFQVLIADAHGQMVSSTVDVSVQDPDSGHVVTVSPYEIALPVGFSQQFTATVWDDLGDVVTASVAWSTSSGSITTGGVYTASAGGLHTVTATYGAADGIANVIVTDDAAVSLAVVDSEGYWDGLIPARVRLVRSGGSSSSSIDVLIDTVGDGEAGVDYADVSGTVTIPAGEDGIDVYITPLAEAAAVGLIDVTVRVLYSPGYLTVSPSEGTVSLYMRPGPPIITLVSPAADQDVFIPSSMGLMATASVYSEDPNSLVLAWESPEGLLWDNTQALETGVRFPGDGEYVLQLRASDVYGESLTAFTVHVGADTSSGQPPQGEDIGSVEINGSTSYDDVAGTYTLRVHKPSSSGADIWNSPDGFHYAYQSLEGDGAITARVASITGTVQHSKIGIMMRASNAANAMYAATIVTNNQAEVRHMRRTATDGGTTSTANTSTDKWIRLVRSGNVFTSFRSADGVSWTQIQSHTNNDMPGTILVGLALASQNSTDPMEAVIADVTGLGIPINVGPYIIIEPVVGAQVATPFSLTAEVTDDDLPDPPAAVTLAWQHHSGSGTAVFDTAHAASTTVTVSDPGIHAFRLVADDGAVITFAQQEVDVVSANTVGTIALADDSYTVAGDAGSIGIVVRRQGGTEGAVQVQYATSDGTATAAIDYIAASGTLHWADGDAQDKVITVTILAVTRAADVTFFCALSEPGGGADLGTPHSATVTILEDPATRRIAIGAESLPDTEWTITPEEGAIEVDGFRRLFDGLDVGQDYLLAPVGGGDG